MKEKLKKWQIIYIDNIKYLIINMIEFEEDKNIWYEYEIRDELGKSKILCIENENEYYIYTPYSGDINEKDKNLNINGRDYEILDEGTAIVKNYLGNVDVDIREQCQYINYISNDKKHIISIEKWDDGVEKSQGEYIDSSRIRITDTIEEPDAKQYKNNIKENKKKSKIAMIIIPILAVIVIFIVNIFNSNPLQKYIEKNSKYEYITSITNNVNRKKARVYKSSFSTIDETVKDIIDGIPEKITNVTDSANNTNENGIGIHTKNEFAYVYLENGAVYVQVSDKKYVSNGGSTYHSYYSPYYYGAFNSSNKNSVYSNYADSARQQSVNSRRASGGGISFGK